MSTSTVQTSTQTGTAGRPHEAGGPDPRRWLVLGVVAVAQLMVVLDATIVNIALPSAQKALGFADTDRQWIVTAYALAFGSLLLLGGKLGDLFGRKATFLTGLVGFALASALGGAAQSFGVLVGARALQGIFGALLAPAALATLATTFTDPKERSKAFGIFGAVAGGGSAVGLVLGGLLTEYLSWRYCLYVNLVFAAGAFAGAFVLLTNTRSPHRPRLDVPGTVLASAGLFCLVYGFSHASTAGWGDPLTLGVLVAGAVLLVGFVLVERRVSAPLLPLRVVADRVRGGSYLAVGLSAVAIFGVFLFLTYYLQEVKGFSPIVSGLAFLPLTAGIVSASTSANIVLLPRTGPRPLATGGMVLGAVGMFLLSRLTPDSSYAGHVLPSLIVLGLGFGLIFAPAISSATYGIAGQDAGVASAMVNTMQQVGGSVGTALLSTVAASSTTSFARSHPGPGAAAFIRAAVHGYTTAFTVSALIFTVGAVIVGLLLPSGVLTHGGPPAQQPRPDGAAAAAPERADAPAPERPAVPAPAPARAAAPSAPAAPTGPPWAVWGRAVGPDGAPLADAVLTLTDLAGAQADRTHTDAAGDFRLVPGTAGSYLVIVVSPGLRPSVSTVAVGSAHVRRDVELVGTGGLRGQVRSGGRPVGDARLTLMDDRGEIVAATATDARGGYLLEDLDGGESTLTVAAPGHRSEVSSVSVPVDRVLEIDLDLVAVGEVAGSVRAMSDGRPLPESIVTLVDGDGVVVASGLTDERGDYRFADVVPGAYTVTASGFGPVASRVEVSGGANRLDDLELGWDRRGAGERGVPAGSGEPGPDQR